MQLEENTNSAEFTDMSTVPAEGRILALDLGTKKVGIAVCDETRLTTRSVAIVKRSGWKKFLKSIKAFLVEFDAVALIIGLPLESDGSESEMSLDARDVARKFALSLEIPVILQDERVSTYQARGDLWRRGASETEIRETLDSEAARVILEDFLDIFRAAESRNQGDG